MIKSKLPLLLAGLCAAVGLGSCSDEATPSAAVTLADVVVLKATSAQRTEFALYAPGSQEPATLVAEGRTISSVPVGNRLLISYVPQSGEPYTSGTIDLRGAAKINNDALRAVSADELAGWDADPVYLYSAWLAGPYLNFRVGLTYDSEPRTFFLVMVDDAHPGSCPTLYLAHRRADIDPRPNFMRTYYASFDLTALLSHAEVQAADVRVNNSNLTTLSTLHFDLR